MDHSPRERERERERESYCLRRSVGGIKPAPLLVQSLYFISSSAIFCGYPVRFVSDLVGKTGLLMTLLIDDVPRNVLFSLPSSW